MLSLSRPLVILDLEATGTDPETARIIQVCAQRVEPDGEGLEATESLNRLVDPERPIPTSVQKLTGWSERDIKTHGSPWRDVAPELSPLIEDADLAGYNIETYDYPLLEAEYERLGREVPGPEQRLLVDVYNLEKQLNPRTLENVYGRYTGESLGDAHDAAADVSATWEVLVQQLATHGLRGSSPEDLVDEARGEFLDAGRKLRERPDGSVEVCFGKHSGKTLSELQEEAPDYLKWMYGEITELQSHIDHHLE